MLSYASLFVVTFLAATVLPLTFEIPHFIMERRMLLGIKERAERAENTQMTAQS